MRFRVPIVALLLCALAACQPSGEGGMPELKPIPAPPDVAAPPADAVRTSSGLASKVLQVGMSNVRPGPRNNVRVHYTGWTTDGVMFDSSVARGEPAEFGVSNVIPGWTEGLQLMVVGEKRRFWIPGNLAYDVPGTPPEMPKGMLVFDVELLAVK
jgi:peptidylprolyl isomerase